MSTNRDEVISIRINKYYPHNKETRDLLLRAIKPLFDKVFGPEGSEGVVIAVPVQFGSCAA